MATGPFQSKLNPYYDEIAMLRACQPPVTYAHIAAILNERHQLQVHRGTIQHFVKVRSTRTVYRLPQREERSSITPGKAKTTGMVPRDVHTRVEKPRRQVAPPEPEHRPYLPSDGRLTYKEKS